MNQSNRNRKFSLNDACLKISAQDIPVQRAEQHGIQTFNVPVHISPQFDLPTRYYKATISKLQIQLAEANKKLTITNLQLSQMSDKLSTYQAQIRRLYDQSNTTTVQSMVNLHVDDPNIFKPLSSLQSTQIKPRNPNDFFLQCNKFREKILANQFAIDSHYQLNEALMESSGLGKHNSILKENDQLLMQLVQEQKLENYQYNQKQMSIKSISVVSTISMKEQPSFQLDYMKGMVPGKGRSHLLKFFYNFSFSAMSQEQRQKYFQNQFPLWQSSERLNFIKSHQQFQRVTIQMQTLVKSYPLYSEFISKKIDEWHRKKQEFHQHWKHWRQSNLQNNEQLRKDKCQRWGYHKKKALEQVLNKKGQGPPSSTLTQSQVKSNQKTHITNEKPNVPDIN